MKPAFSISLGGADITGRFDDRLIDMNVDLVDGHESDSVTFKLDDRDFALSAPPTDAELSISLGYVETGLVLLGIFSVDEVEVTGPPYSMTIHAKAADQKKAQKQHRTRAYEKKKLGDIVKEVAGRYGLSPAISEELSSVEYPYLHQSEESDWHMLTRLSKDHDALFSIKNKKLIFAKRGEGKSFSGLGMPSVTLTLPDLLVYRASQKDRPKHKDARGSWHDKTKGKVSVERSQGGGGGEASYNVRHLRQNSKIAKSAAQSQINALRRAEGGVSVVIEGNAQLQPEGTLVIQTGRSVLDGEFPIKSVSHRYNESGFQTTITATAGNNGASSGGGGS